MVGRIAQFGEVAENLSLGLLLSWRSDGRHVRSSYPLWICSIKSGHIQMPMVSCSLQMQIPINLLVSLTLWIQLYISFVEPLNKHYFLSKMWWTVLLLPQYDINVLGDTSHVIWLDFLGLSAYLSFFKPI